MLSSGYGVIAVHTSTAPRWKCTPESRPHTALDVSPGPLTGQTFSPTSPNSLGIIRYHYCISIWPFPNPFWTLSAVLVLNRKQFPWESDALLVNSLLFLNINHLSKTPIFMVSPCIWFNFSFALFFLEEPKHAYWRKWYFFAPHLSLIYINYIIYYH